LSLSLYSNSDIKSSAAMDGHAALPSSPSVSLWRCNAQRKRGEDRDFANKTLPINMRQHAESCALLPSRTSPNRRLRDNNPPAKIDGITTLRSAQPPIPELGMGIRQGSYIPPEMRGHPPVKHTGCVSNMRQIAVETVGVYEQVHRVVALQAKDSG